MTRDIDRMLRPRSIAVIGGGAWGQAVLEQAQKFGFAGTLYPIHPSRDDIVGLPTYRGVPDLPTAPDATFIGINRDATIGAVERLHRAGAGGAVCFASGFTEAQAEDDTGATAQARLLKAAGDMPILGPNCYGFINALDGAIVWPDQHGLSRVDRGVAILTQSSNIAINLTFQRRSLPIAMMITCGNMAQLSQAAIVDALLEDPRITAIGLHIEGFSDLSSWDAIAQKAHAQDIPLVALKAGRSDAAQAAAQSHTASLAGEDAGAQALLDFLGIGRVDSLSAFLEALKLGHVIGRLSGTGIASISCSGGEASLAADTAAAHGLHFPPLSKAQTQTLRNVLGQKVALANPLDYHTYIWRDAAAMTAAWGAMASPDTALTLSIVDIPDADRADPTDWECATTAIVDAKAQTKAPFAMVSSLAETMPADTALRLMKAGIAPLQGLDDAMAAMGALVRRTPRTGLIFANVYPTIHTYSEFETKQQLAAHRISTPKSAHADRVADLTFPVAIKASGLMHKTEAGGVVLNVATIDGVTAALANMPTSDSPIFIEEMVQGGIAELLVAFTNDQAHGIMLTLGAGGTLTELWQDTQHLILPVTPDDIDAALSRLRIAPIINGYRGKPGADRAAICNAVMGLQDFVLHQPEGLVELEINPLICTQTDAIVADALWRHSYPEPK